MPTDPTPCRADPRHTLGRFGEQLAAEHLERLGYRVIARNHRTRFGEIDLVVADDETIVFCEVKTRRAASGAPRDAPDERKRKRGGRMGAPRLCGTHKAPHAARVR